MHENINRIVASTLFVMLLLLASTASAQSQRRVALVIGNGAYQHAGALRNPPNDARRMAEVLRSAGFEVILGINLSRQAMEGHLREFGDRLEGGQLGLFFYAGHGMQVGGENYLLPVDATLRRERDLAFETIPLSQVLRSMETAAPTNLLFLDACRDNPLTRSFAASMGARSTAVGRGLAQVQSGVGTLVAYATAPNSVAEDGVGATNSPFTAALAQHLTTPGLEVGLALRRVREAVLTATAGRQVPWDHSSLTGEVVIVPAAAAAPSPIAPPQPTAPPAATIEVAFWQSIQESRNVADFDEYLRRFPQGTFAGLARNRIAALRAPQAPASLPSPPPSSRPGSEAPAERWAPPPTTGGTFGHLSGLIGTYDTSRIFDDPEISQKLRSMLGTQMLSRLRQNTRVGGPVAFDGAYIIVSGLAPHLGGEEEGILAIRPSDGAIEVGLLSTNRVYAYGPEARGVLSQAVQRFLTDHRVGRPPVRYQQVGGSIPAVTPRPPTPASMPRPATQERPASRPPSAPAGGSCLLPDGSSRNLSGASCRSAGGVFLR